MKRGQKQQAIDVTKVSGELGPGCCCPGWSPDKKGGSGRASHVHEVSKLCSAKGGVQSGQPRKKFSGSGGSTNGQIKA